MKKIIALTLLLIGLLVLTESCSTHRKPGRPCKGGNWSGNMMNKRIW